MIQCQDCIHFYPIPSALNSDRPSEWGHCHLYRKAAHKDDKRMEQCPDGIEPSDYTGMEANSHEGYAE
jgi:hypothetical protein